MKATINLAGGTRSIEVEGDSQKDLFEEMAQAYEVFNESTCGLCDSTNIRPVHRVADKYHFYEYQCQDCFGKLTFGQNSDNVGKLFPVRKLLENGKPSWKDGEYGDHRGWTKYRGDNHPDDSPQQNTAQHPPQSRASTHDGLPPEDHFGTLKSCLKFIGAKDGQEADAVIQFCTAKAPGGKITYESCSKHPMVCKTALDIVEAKNREFPKDCFNPLIDQVREWMRGGK